MIQRRNFISGALAIGGCGLYSSQILADEVAATAAQTTPALTPTEQLMYSTVRLVYQTPQQTKWGTAFLFAFFKTDASSVLALVTNRHVVEGMQSCSFSLAGTDNNGMPDLNNHIPITIDNFSQAWLGHPSVDLAIIPVGKLLNELNRKPFIIHLDPTLIPTDEELKSFTPVEQVLTVGYPGQLWDEVHNVPIFHRGYTATAPYIEFKGRKEFLIDFTTWPGASGSPVFIYNEGGWIDRKGNTIMGGIRAKLVGVVYGVALQDVSGNVLIQAGPTSVAAPGRMAVPANLGACIMASRILDFEPLIIRQGFQAPSGYKMRAQ
jgi:hypothetical protein